MNIKLIRTLSLATLLGMATSPAISQTQFWSDNFEDSGAPSSGTRTPSVENSFGSPATRYFFRTNLAGIALQNAPYTGIEGSKFWAAEDIDAALTGANFGQSANQNVTWTVNITGKTGITLRGLFAANNVGSVWDGSSFGAEQDFLIIEYRINGGAWTKALAFYANSAGSGPLALDNNADLIGDGTALSPAFTEFTADITGTGTTLELRLNCYANGGTTEEMAIDNLRLFETLVSTPAITTNPSNISLCSGSTTSFTVAASNTPTSYTWQVSTNGGGNWTTITAGNAGSTYTNYTSATLNLSNVTAAMNGYQYRASATNAGGTSAYSSAAVLTAFTGTWNGGTNAFNTSGNWTGCPVTTGINAIIANAGTAPQVAGTSAANNITINSGASLTVAGGTLSIGGAISNSGTFISSAGTVVLNGSAAQSIPASAFAGNTIQNLTINNVAGVALNGTLNLTGALTLSAGTLTTNDNLVLKSSASATARVAQITGGSISGRVTVERYIPAKRAWRFLTAPVNTIGSIYTNWQEGGASPSGYGTHIFGPVGSTNGLDVATSHSLFGYNVGTNSWNAVTSTNQAGNVFSAGTGYRMFVRGDRTQAINPSSPPPANVTTLRAIGTLLTGNVTFAGGAAVESPASLPPLNNTVSGFSLVGNPYASPVDIELIAAASANINTDYYWAWDAVQNGANGRGKYVVYDMDLHTNDVGGASQVDKNIQSGQAFFVQTTAANPTLVFTEARKTAVNRNVFKTTTPTAVVQVKLFLDGTTLADGVYAKYGSAYNNAVNYGDAVKFTNTDENLSILRGNADLSVEARAAIMVSDTIPLNVWQLADNGNYKLVVNTENMPGGITGYVEDMYVNQVYPLTINGAATDVNFTVQTANTGSYGGSRFRIILNTGIPLATETISITAAERINAVDITWDVKEESVMHSYEVEHSTDGKLFASMRTEPARTNAGEHEHYSYTDTKAGKGNNYYRIKGLKSDKSVVYSKTVMVTLNDDGKGAIAIYPNPVRGSMLQLQFADINKGVYIMRILNEAGQQVLKREFNHNGGNATLFTELPPSLATGKYMLQITGNGHEHIQPLMIIK